MSRETGLTSKPRSGRRTTRKDRLADGSALTRFRQGALLRSQHPRQEQARSLAVPPGHKEGMTAYVILPPSRSTLEKNGKNKP